MCEAHGRVYIEQRADVTVSIAGALEPVPNVLHVSECMTCTGDVRLYIYLPV